MFRPAGCAVLVVIVAACGEKAPPQTPAAGAGAPKTPVAGEADPRMEPRGFHPVAVEPPHDLDSTGRYGGTLVWAEPGELATFNPLIATDVTSTQTSTLSFDALTSYDNAKQQIAPSLAWKWESSADGKTWTFHLRKGVKWSDGQPFTSRDVLFTFRACFHPKIQNPAVDGFKIGDAPLPTLEAPDDHTVVFHCSALDVLFLIHAGSLQIMPAHLWEKTIEGNEPTFASAMGVEDVSRVVGTGLFRAASYDAGEKIVFERNPYSWRATKGGQRLPFVDRVIVKIVKDQATLSLQFRNGDLDLIDGILALDYNAFKEKEAEGWFTLHRLGLSLNTTYACLNQHPGKDPKTGEPFVAPHKLAWFQDRRFRQALSHAIDRTTMVKQLLEGKGEPIFAGNTRADKQWYVEVTRFDHDPAKANALLDEMGLAKRGADGIRRDAGDHKVSIELMTNADNSLRGKVITQIKADWAAVGIEAVLRPIDFNSVVTATQSTHRWEAIVLGWGTSVPPDPLNGKNVLLSSGEGHVWYPNQPQPANDFERRNDALVDRMSQEVDLEKRKALHAELAELNAQEQGFIWLYAQNAYAASKKRVQNMKATVLPPATWWNLEELWVEDAK